MIMFTQTGTAITTFLNTPKSMISKTAGFDGVVSGSETIQANFVPTEARFVKITFENAGTAIDEVEAFMVTAAFISLYPNR